jgi:hypothetical protein
MRVPAVDPIAATQQEALQQFVQLMGQKGALQQPQAPATGIRERGQQSFSEVFTDPSQAQVNAGLAGVLGALNPNSQAPLVSGLAGGLSALQAQRAREFQSKQQQFENQLKYCSKEWRI